MKLWEWHHTKQSTIFDIQLNKLKSIQTTDDIELWLKRSAAKFYKRCKFWHIFFQDFGIKLHLDSIEFGLETIIKQLAIRSLGGTSIGKVRSHPMSIDFWYFYPNDVFFSWSLETAKRNEHLFEKDDVHRLMIDISRGVLGTYEGIKDIHKGPNVIIADFPLKWTVRGMGKLFETSKEMV